MHGCGGWLGLVLYIGPGWGYGGGPRRRVGRCGLLLTRGRGDLGVCEIGCLLGYAGGEESSLGSLERFVSNASNGARVIWGFSEVLVPPHSHTQRPQAQTPPGQNGMASEIKYKRPAAYIICGFCAPRNYRLGSAAHGFLSAAHDKPVVAR
eukprot:scaffold3092_cov121-Isochrysis_galbana.AAC.9